MADKIPTWDETVPVSEPIPTWDETVPASERPVSEKFMSALHGDYVKDSEIKDIAGKYGVSKEVLRMAVSMQNANREQGIEEPIYNVALTGLQKSAGAVNQALGGLPFKAFTQIAHDENTRHAIDEINKISVKRQSYLDKIAEFSIPAPSLIGKGAKYAEEAAAAIKAGKYLSAPVPLVKAAASAAPVGAAFGYGSSETGKELKGAATGAAVAAVATPALVAGIPTAIKGWHWLNEYKSPAQLGDLVEKAQTALEARAAKETTVKETLLGTLKDKASLDNAYVENPNIGRWILGNDDKFDRMVVSLKRTGMGEAEAEEVVTKRIIESEQVRLAKELESGVSAKTAGAVLDKHLSGVTGEEQLGKIYDGLRLRDQMIVEARREMPSLVEKVDEGSIADYVIGSQHVAAESDRKFGTTLESDLADLVNNHDLSTMRSHAMTESIKPLLADINKSVTFSGKEGGKFLTQVAELGASGRERAVALGMITEEESKLAGRVADAFENLGSRFKDQGLAFAERRATDGSASYVHHTMVAPDEFRARVLDSYSDLKGTVLSVPVREIKANEEKFKDSIDLIKSLEIAGGKPIANKEDILDAVAHLRSGERGTASRVAAAKATLERGGEIPDLVREYSLDNVMNQYISNGNRNLALRDPVRNIKNQIKVLKSFGENHIASYMEDLVSSALGGAGRQFSIEKAATAWKDKRISKIVSLEKEKKALLEKAVESSVMRNEQDITKAAYASNPKIESLDKAIAREYASRDTPDLLNYFVRTSMFSNFLGGKVKAGVRDLLQPFTMGINEIGGSYGWAKITDGYARSVASPKRMAGWAEELRQRGLLPYDYQHQLTTLAADDTVASGVSKKIREFGDKYSKVMSAARTGADITNRKVMLEASKSVAADYMRLKTIRAKAEETARRTALSTSEEGINKLRPAEAGVDPFDDYLQKEFKVNEAGSFGDVELFAKEGEKAGRRAEDFINNRLGPAYRTQIRALERTNALSQEKLETILANHLINRTQFRYNKVVASEMSRELGPLLTQFSKYPSEVLGSYVTEHRRFGGAATVRKALYPLLSLVAMDQLRQGITGDSALSPREKVFNYARGMKDASPVTSILGLVPGGGPELTTYANVLRALSQPDKFKALLKSSAAAINPAGAAMNVVDDLHRIITGEDPG